MVTFNVTVSSGTGSVVIPPNNFGKGVLTCFKVPATTNPQFSYNFVDPDGFGLSGSGFLQGATSAVGEYPLATGGVFTITSNVDGVYPVRIYQSTDQR